MIVTSHLRPLRRVAVARDVAHGVGEHAVVDIGSPRHGGTRREEAGQFAVRQTVVAVLVVLVEQVVEELHALIRQLRAARRRHFDAASNTHAHCRQCGYVKTCGYVEGSTQNQLYVCTTYVL